MKFFLLLYFLIIGTVLIIANEDDATNIIGTVEPYFEITQKVLGFAQKTYEVSKGSRRRFRELRHSLASIGELDSYNVTNFSNAMVYVLHHTIDNFSSMIIDMRRMCIANVKIHKEYVRFIKDNIYKSEYKMMLKNCFGFANKMIDQTLTKSIEFREKISVIEANISIASISLVDLQKTFNENAEKIFIELNDTTSNSDREIENARYGYKFENDIGETRIKDTKDSVKQKLELLNKYIVETNTHVKGLIESVHKLKEESQLRGTDVSILQVMVINHKDSVQRLNNLLSDVSTDEKTMNYVLNELDVAVNNISDLSKDFLIKTRTEKNGAISISVVPDNGTLKKFKQTNELLQHLDHDETLLAYFLSSFFENHLELLNKLRSSFKTSAESLAEELSKIKDTTIPDGQAEVVLWTSLWEDSMSRLRRLGVEWNSYLETSEGVVRRAILSVRKFVISSSRKSFKSFTCKKIDELIKELKKFSNGTLRRIVDKMGELRKLVETNESRDYNGNPYSVIDPSAVSDSETQPENVAFNFVKFILNTTETFYASGACNRPAYR